MKPWEMDEIRRATKAKWLARGSAAVPFNGHVCTDSRKAATGDLFVAIKGARFDAHDYVRQVIEAGVRLTVWSEDAEVAEVAEGDGRLHLLNAHRRHQGAGEQEGEQ